MNHEHYMNRCLQLAQLGMPLAKPNPLVGSVIVHDQHIIGEGFHQKYGEAHAEVNAVNSVNHPELLKASTLYVNLEPCAHFGKTPPCADLIIKHQIPRVVIGCTDPFNEVSGKGIQRLIDYGIEVITNILQKESLWLNRRFFTFHQKKRPYVILKWAQTADGFLDKIRHENDFGVNWITHPSTKQLVHRWRAEEDAILVGYNTWITDKPSLTVREVEGNSPRRIILSKYRFNPPLTSDIVFTGQPAELMDLCFREGIQSILIEGGAKTLDLFISAGLWDEARVLIGSSFFQEGIKAPRLKNELLKESRELLHGDKRSLYIKE